MRNKCPVCNSDPIDTLEMNYAVPDGWSLSSVYRWHLCTCGFIWADTDVTVDGFDEYYRNNYAPHIDEHDLVRLQKLAGFVFDNIRPDAQIVDYGGGDGYIERFLVDLGFINVKTVNLDDELPNCIDVLILSQVVEHLYDLERDLSRVNARLDDNAIIIIETPEAISYSARQKPMLDYYPTHVNHFTVQTLNNLVSRYGWTMTASMNYEYRATQAPMMRCIYQNGLMKKTFDNVKNNISEIQKLEAGEKVILYGLGDLALYQIANNDLDIAYFVDEADIYKGVTINGIPIKQQLDDDDYPVMVLGKRHKDEILEKLKGRRVINEVI